MIQKRTYQVLAIWRRKKIFLATIFFNAHLFSFKRCKKITYRDSSTRKVVKLKPWRDGLDPNY